MIFPQYQLLFLFKILKHSTFPTYSINMITFTNTFLKDIWMVICKILSY